MILYRIAKVSDAKQIAQIHYSVRHKHPLGIFSQMGFSFLKQYYRVILDDPYEIIICAENDKREIVGFNSGTLDANWQMNTLRRHKLSLGLAALGSIICNPRLIKPLVQRYKSTAKKSNYQFVYKEGARGDFWAWKPGDKNSLDAVALSLKANAVFAALGVKYKYIEVDTDNKEVLAFHKAQKAEVEQTIVLPDGRERVLMKKILKKFCLVLCLMVTIFSVVSVSITAEEIRQNKEASAASIMSGDVPTIGTPLASRSSASFRGVWPPYWTITP